MAFVPGLVVLALLAAAPAAAEESARIEAFADSLFEQGEYFRAATEYLRLLSYEPGRADADELRLNVARCSFKAGRFTEAGVVLSGLIPAVSSTILREDCRLLLAASRFRLDEHAAAVNLCDESLSRSPAPEYRDRFVYLKGLSLLNLGRPREAGDAFAAVPASSPFSASAGRLRSLAESGATTRRARPWLTGTLSALVPGMGQIACGYSWDGLAAMALTGAGLAIGISGVRRDDSGTAAAGFALFTVWHSANIYGGANAARRLNAARRHRLLAEAGALSTLSLD